MSNDNFIANFVEFAWEKNLKIGQHFTCVIRKSRVLFIIFYALLQFSSVLIGILSVKKCLCALHWWMLLLRQCWSNCLCPTFTICIPFLARDSIYAIAHYMPSPVHLSDCPSVPLSVTRVDQSKMVKVRIAQLSPQSSPMTLVSWRQTAPWNSKGKIGSGGAE